MNVGWIIALTGGLSGAGAAIAVGAPKWLGALLGGLYAGGIILLLWGVA